MAMASIDALLATSPSTIQDPSSQRKSRRATRKPDLFAEEHHEGSLINSNGSVKRKRQQISDAYSNQNGGEEAARSPHDEDEDEDVHGDDEDEDSAVEEDSHRNRTKSTNRIKKATSKSSTKRPRISHSPSRTLAIRPAKVPSKSALQKGKAQKARSRPSQIAREGLYGRHPEELR
jgi:hypothetical protein